MSKHQPIMLLILDGWGYSEQQEANAISAANTPNFDKLWQQCPHTLLKASGQAVGLPEGQMGNSEVGHLHIGAGRPAPQDLTRINTAIQSGEFALNDVLTNMVEKTKQAQGALHIFGLLSNGGVHSHTRHIYAMANLAKQHGLNKIYLHAFLDGRDTPPKSAAIFIQETEQFLQSLGTGKIVSLSGRYYAMDRDKRWDRIQQAFDMLTLGQTPFHAKTAQQGLQQAYARGETDEFVKPTAIHSQTEQPITIQDNDSIIFMNFRADRGRELSHAFTDPEFTAFKRSVVPKLTEYVTLTQYAADLNAKVAFKPLELHNILGEVIAQHKLTQLRIAETEKYAHVTYFLNGGEEKQFPFEDRILIPSPKVATYDLQPEMSALKITDKLMTVIASKKYHFIICNFANPDMVGHTGNFAATVKALEIVDTCIGKIVATLHKVSGELIIIADHGNAEKMLNTETGQPQTAHTCGPVPFIYMGRNARITHEDGTLIDVAPTLLYLLDIPIPEEMTGKSLVELRP